jgi:chromosome segregation ATPase
MALVITQIYDWQPHGVNQHKGGGILSIHPQKSSRELAEIADVSEATIKKAKFVYKCAAPEVQAAVKSGEIGIIKAASIAKLPKENQAKAIKAPIPKTPNFDSASFVPSDQELAAADAYEAEEVAKIMQIRDSDDRFAAAMDALKRLAKEVSQLKLQRDALKRKNDRAVDNATRLRSQLEAIRKIDGEQYVGVAAVSYQSHSGEVCV